MKEFNKIDLNNRDEAIEFLSRLSELVKCTLVGFGWAYKMENEFISTKNFAYRFGYFLPKGYEDIGNLPYDKIFVGKNSKDVVGVYKKLLEIYFEIEDFRMPPSVAPKIGYHALERMLEEADRELDRIIEEIKQ